MYSFGKLGCLSMEDLAETDFYDHHHTHYHFPATPPHPSLLLCSVTTATFITNNTANHCRCCCFRHCLLPRPLAAGVGTSTTGAPSVPRARPSVDTTTVAAATSITILLQYTFFFFGGGGAGDD